MNNYEMRRDGVDGTAQRALVLFDLLFSKCCLGFIVILGFVLGFVCVLFFYFARRNFKKILASRLVSCIYLSVCLSPLCCWQFNSNLYYTYTLVARFPRKKWSTLGKSRSKFS